MKCPDCIGGYVYAVTCDDFPEHRTGTLKGEISVYRRGLFGRRRKIADVPMEDRVDVEVPRQCAFSVRRQCETCAGSGQAPPEYEAECAEALIERASA